MPNELFSQLCYQSVLHESSPLLHVAAWVVSPEIPTAVRSVQESHATLILLPLDPGLLVCRISDYTQHPNHYSPVPVRRILMNTHSSKTTAKVNPVFLLIIWMVNRTANFRDPDNNLCNSITSWPNRFSVGLRGTKN